MPLIERSRELLGEELVQELAALPESTAHGGTLYCHASPLSDMDSFYPEPQRDGRRAARWAWRPSASCSATPTSSSCATGRAGSSSSTPAASASRSTATGAPPTRSWATTASVELRRVEYDWQAAANAVRAKIGELPAKRIEQARFDVSVVLPSAAVRLSSVLAPRDREFFDLFEEAGGNILRAAGLLEEMLRDFPERNELARDILICEQDGDRITHDIIQRLNQTFVTPIDREDIYELASALDDVVDYTEEVADYLGLYKIEAPMEQAQELAQVLHAAARQIAEAMPRLRGFKDISHYTVEINRLENDGDRITREAIASLFDNGIDPMVVIRWKDIFERLEEAIDATEHVANILEGIVIKNS